MALVLFGLHVRSFGLKLEPGKLHSSLACSRSCDSDATRQDGGQQRQRKVHILFIEMLVQDEQEEHHNIIVLHVNRWPVDSKPNTTLCKRFILGVLRSLLSNQIAVTSSIFNCYIMLFFLQAFSMINECDIYAVSYFYLFFNVVFLISFCAAACVSQDAPARF